MDEFRQLNKSDLVAVLGLSAQLQTMPADILLRRQQTMQLVLDLLPCRVVLMATLRGAREAEVWEPVWMTDAGWENDQQREFMLRHMSGRYMSEPFVARVDLQEKDCVTHRRRDIMDDDAWYALPEVTQVLRPAGLDDCLVTVQRVGIDGWAGGFCVFRSWNDREPFSARDKALMHCLNRQLTWMFRQEAAVSAVAGAGMPKRMHQVLVRLCSGDSEKQIARTLDLSPHTVHEHIKRLYRRFGVRSRGELLSRFFSQSLHAGLLNAPPDQDSDQL